MEPRNGLCNGETIGIAIGHQRSRLPPIIPRPLPLPSDNVSISLPSPPTIRRVSEPYMQADGKAFVTGLCSPLSVMQQTPSPPVPLQNPYYPMPQHHHHRPMHPQPRILPDTQNPVKYVSPEASTQPRRAQQDGYYYVLGTLHRSHSEASWGLSIHQVAPGIYILSDVSKSTAVLRGYCEVPSATVHPMQFLYKNQQTLGAWTRQLLSPGTPPIATTAPTPVTSAFRPGDVILSVGGHPAGEYKALGDWCQWLRTAGASSLWVVVRCNEPKDVFTWVRGRDTGIPAPVRKQLWIQQQQPSVAPVNKAFRKEDGTFLRYDDSTLDDPDEGHRADLFIKPVADFSCWLESRKRSWRQLYSVHALPADNSPQDEDFTDDEEEGVAIDFWTSQGFESFQDWLSTRTKHWQSSYSWNRQKRQRLVQDCQGSTQVSVDGDWQAWLRVRKNQWRVQRRRRQRERGEAAVSTVMESAIVDGLLEEQEQERKAWESRPPLDITFLFKADVGCPDDVVHRVLSFLRTPDRAVLLRVSRTTRNAIQGRERLWHMLCPGTWTLPRRPRKPWHQIYWEKLRVETERRKKRWDDLLSRGSQLLFHGDQLSVLEKMVREGEAEFGFDVNYVSGVVCERNSLLNLAVIHQRHRVVRWLVETKKADIESSDRGSFTPLLNAAWAGDKFLVRFLMQHGANRAKRGTFHYTKPLAPPDFKGLTAEEWAEKRGHDECAKVLRLGL